jgi:hypothetical protein
MTPTIIAATAVPATTIEDETTVLPFVVDVAASTVL